MLTFVFVNALHLHIKQGCGIHEHPELLMDVIGQALLGQRPHAAPTLQEAPIAQQWFEPLELL